MERNQLSVVNPKMRKGKIKKCFKLQAPCVLYVGQAFRYSPENAFYTFNQQIYFIICYLFDRASLIQTI